MKSDPNEEGGERGEKKKASFQLAVYRKQLVVKFTVTEKTSQNKQTASDREKEGNNVQTEHIYYDKLLM